MFLQMNLQLLHHLILILHHQNQPLMEICVCVIPAFGLCSMNKL